MIYSEAKTKLETNGFSINAIQSGSILPIISFTNPKIIGEVFVAFTDNEKLIPKEIGELEEININDSRLLIIELDNIEFDINKSISYLSDNIIDAYGKTDDNIIGLFKDDLKYLDKVLEIIIDPLSLIDFNNEYSKNLELFFKKVKRLLPSLMNNDEFSFNIFKDSGDINCLYSNRIVECIINSHIEISFYFTTLTFNNKIVIYTPLETEEIDIDCNIEKFDIIIKKHINNTKNHINNINNKLKNKLKNK